jgi:hypothetical protein
LKLTDKDYERKYESFTIITDLKKIIKKEDFDSKLQSIEMFIQKN